MFDINKEIAFGFASVVALSDLTIDQAVERGLLKSWLEIAQAFSDVDLDKIIKEANRLLPMIKG